MYILVFLLLFEVASRNLRMHFPRTFQVYDAINENPEAPNISFPDEDEAKAIVDFHACKSDWSVAFCALIQ